MMPDVYTLVEIGRASVATVWLPVAIWTLLASASEAALRLTRAHASVGVPVRSALLLGLPLVLLVPALLSAFAPEAVTAVAAFRPAPLVLPEISVGTAPVEAAPPSVALGWALLGLVTLALALAAAVGLLRWAVSLLRLRRLRDGLEPASPPLQRQLDAARAGSGLQTPVEAAVCAPGTAPFTFGWRRPVVAVPPTLDGEPLRLALDHELAHVRHRDFLWNGLDRGAAALGTAHPLVHVLARHAALGREQLADASVLAARPDQRRAYADLLLSFASLPAPRLALGTTHGSSLLQTRITTMTRTVSPTRLRQFAAAGRALALGALALLLGTAAAFAGPDAPSPSTAAAPDLASDAPLSSNEYADGSERAAVPSDGRTFSFAQDAALEGRITDADTGDPLVGANVVIVGTQTGAASDIDGRFQLDAPDEAFSLRVSFVGYETRVVEVDAGQARLDVALRPVAPGEDRAMRERMEEMRDQAGPGGIYAVVTTAPTLIGGLSALQGRVVYPDAAKADGAQGRVFVQFVVDEEGQVQDATIARSPDPRLGEAALAAVRATEFTPGRTADGQAVKVRYALPVNFKLPGAQTGANASGRSEAPRPDVYIVVEEPPELIGGLATLQQAVTYPASAKADGVEGRVMVEFVVDTDGSVANPVVVRSPDDRLSEAALSAVRQARFTPGRQKGEAVKVRFALPVSFALPSGGGDGRDRGANQPDGSSQIDRGRF